MNESNPIPDDPCTPDDDQRGLSTGLSGPRDEEITGEKDSRGDAVLEGPYLIIALGGALASLCFGDIGTSPRIGPKAACGGETKKKVTGFSAKSRRRLLRMIAEICWDALEESGTRIFFLTLTYPHRWPEDPAAGKAHLRSLLKRLERRYGPSCASFWRMAMQSRGAW